MEIINVSRLEVWHKDYNLERKDNLNNIPAEKGIYGIFAMVNQEPINCRYINESENIQKAIVALFEKPESEGLKKFMQGPWIQILQYELMPNSSREQIQKALVEWTKKYKPSVNEDGEYPGYYSY